MRISPGLLLRRAIVGCPALATSWAPGGPASAEAPTDRASVAQAANLAFTQRHRALRHGGIVRAANSWISYRGSAKPARPHGTAGTAGRARVTTPASPAARAGRAAANGDLDMFRIDVGNDPDAFHASADVTRLVRASGSGLRTVAQVNAAMGRSAAGAWGGWTLMVAYEKKSEPLRHLAIRDGFGSLGPREERVVPPGRLDLPENVRGRVGPVAYDGDRGREGDSLSVSTGRGAPTPFGDAANPRDDVLNSTIAEPGPRATKRVPAYANTLGHDSDVLELGKGIPRGGDQLALRIVSQRDAAWVGALFAAVDAKQ